ncbi:MAG TPA: NAD(P)/FAD-dependent oxidoreductase [Candidatus Angelobacter sp.]
MNNRCDVVIAGGSIAGCILAMCYARRGLTVTILEQKDRDDAYKSLCTHFVQPIALPVFQELGLDGPLEQLGALRTKAAFWTSAGWIDPPDDYGDGPETAFAYNIERRLLDPFLRSHAAAHANVNLRMGHRVTRADRSSNGWLVEAQSTNGTVSIEGRLLVAADGRHSRIANLLGNKAESDENQRAALFGYFEGIEAPARNRSIFVLSEPDRGFLYPLCDDRTLLALYVPKATADDWQSSRAPLEQKIIAYFQQFPGIPDISRARLVSPVLGYADYPNMTRKASFSGAAFVGDAALSLDPLSGVGCSFAAVSAHMLAKATAHALSQGEELEPFLASYDKSFMKFFLPHARGIKADSVVAKSPEAAISTYRCVTSSLALQREFVDLTGRIISPGRFQAAYLSTLVKTRAHAHTAQ